MSSSHSHDHHHHAHTVDMSQVNRIFIIGITLNLLFVVIEAAAGFYTNSLALLTDAGHNLSDAAGLALSLMAFRLTKVKAGKNFTYGYSKTTILVALANAIILLIAIGSIGYEAVQRLYKPEPAQGSIMAIVAGIGIVINAASALLFFRDKDKELNMRGAYVHLAADAVVSVGVVIAGIVIFYTHLYWIDSAISIVIMLVILYSTIGLLNDSLRLSLDAVPRNVDLEELKAGIMKMEGVVDIYHIHAWALSTTVNALTAHIVVNENLTATDEQLLKDNIKHELLHLNIHHATLETERGNVLCKEEEC